MDAIEAFLDAADEVLNSNTFLVRIPFPSGDIWRDLRIYIVSGDLQRAMLQADISREWYNMHRISADETPVPMPGRLAADEVAFTQGPAPGGARAYLEAMLQGDTSGGNFISFYRCEKTQAEARRLTAAVLEQLFAGKEPLLYVLEPDFFRETAADAGQLYYFEGRGCDNAAFLVFRTTGYLLLTNGLP
jgi:hypothetical protein